MPKPKTKKKFIDKKNAVKFNLVHRSQRDPLVADETAPQRVLVPVNASIPAKKEKEPELTPEQRKEEQQKYGIYFDDDYNYLQHLKDTREVTLVVAPKTTHKGKEKPSPSTETEEPLTSKLTLPSSVFASAVEEDVGLLNKAAPQGLRLDLDPEVIAALDDDFDYDDPDNQIEDNFIDLAMTEGADEEYNEDDPMSEDDRSGRASVSDLDSDDDSDDSQSSNKKMPKWDEVAKEKPKSYLSEYTISKTVRHRNEGLALLDARFERMYDAEYNDWQVGALDGVEMTGLPMNHKIMLEAAEEFEKWGQRYQLDKDEEIPALVLKLYRAQQEKGEKLVRMKVKPKPQWNCQTILSTYSNTRNQPTIIEEPKKKKISIHPRTGIPTDTLGNGNKLTLKSVAKFNALNDRAEKDSDDDGKTQAESVLSTLSVLSIRPKDETPEEKKKRKKLLKEYRRERRIEKKANKEAFKEETKRQKKIMLNNRNNIQGNRIF